MEKEEDKRPEGRLIGEMRALFARGDWDKVTGIYEQMSAMKTDRSIRLEATCLAVRALAAINQRSAARQLLRTVMGNEYKKAAHYEFLARAHLDLKQYKGASEACERAEALRLTELK